MHKPLKKYCALCGDPVVPVYSQKLSRWHYPKRCPKHFREAADPKSRGFALLFLRNGKSLNSKPEGTRTPHNGNKGLYIKIKQNGIWKFEHRVIMEKALKRKLSPKEVVHHINKDTTDNRIENLQLFSSNGDHLSHHNCKERKCSIVGCERPHKGLGFCALHYQRFKKHGTTDKPLKAKLECSVDGCKKPHEGLGFCPMHLARFRKHGDPLYQKKQRICSVDGCNRKHQSKGFCFMHYVRFKRKGII